MAGYLLDKPTLDRLDRALPRVERGAVNRPVLDPWTVAPESRWVPCINASFSTEIPAFSAVRQAGVISTEGMYLPIVDKMGGTVERDLYIVGPEAIPPQSFGFCSARGELLAQYDPADGTPQPEQTWGPSSTGYKLRKHFPGFRVVQVDSANERCWVMYDPPSTLLAKVSSGTALPGKGSGGSIDVWIGPLGAEFDSNMNVYAYGRSYWPWPRFNTGSPLPNVDWVTLHWNNNAWFCTELEYPVQLAVATANWRVASTWTTVACTLNNGNGVFSGPAVTAVIQRYYVPGLPAPNILNGDKLLLCYCRDEFTPQWYVINPLLDAAIGSVRMSTALSTHRGWGQMNGTHNSVANGGSGFDMTDRFPRAMNSTGTGGADTHTHSITVGGPSGTTAVQSGAGATVASSSHNHSLTVPSISHLPSYRGLYFLERLNNAAP